MREQPPNDVSEAAVHNDGVLGHHTGLRDASFGRSGGRRLKEEGRHPCLLSVSEQTFLPTFALPKYHPSLPEHHCHLGRAVSVPSCCQKTNWLSQGQPYSHRKSPGHAPTNTQGSTWRCAGVWCGAMDHYARSRGSMLGSCMPHGQCRGPSRDAYPEATAFPSSSAVIRDCTPISALFFLLFWGLNASSLSVATDVYATMT